MLDDLTKEIKAQLYERVKSPLFGAFAFSWLAWNYRPILAVLSGMPFDAKLKYLDSLYPSASHWAGYGFGGPLLTAVLFLLAYPYPARWMYRYWANQHKELKKVQQQIEDDTPLTQEEAKALRKASLVQVAELEAEISRQRQLIKELNERLGSAAEEVLRVTRERDQFSEYAKKSSEELSKHLAVVVHDAPQVSTSNHQEEAVDIQEAPPTTFGDVIKEIRDRTRQYQPVGHPLPTSAGEVFGRTEQEGNKPVNRDAEVFRTLCNLDGATIQEIATVLRLGVEETHSLLLNQIRDGKAVRKGDLWGLSEKGKMIKSAQMGLLGS